MPRICFVPGCKTGYPSCPNKIPMFKPPNDSLERSVWQKLIPRNETLGEHSFICALHFEERFIITEDVMTIKGEIVKLPRGRPKLAHGAVPTLFPGLPKYLSKHLPKQRQCPDERKRKAAERKRKLEEEAMPLPKRVFVEDSNSVKGTLENLPIVQKSTVELSVQLKNPPIATRKPYTRDRTTQCTLNVRPAERPETNNSGLLTRLKENVWRLERRVTTLWRKNLELKRQLRDALNENSTLTDRTSTLENLPQRQRRILEQQVKLAQCKNSHGRRYSEEWLVDCVALRLKSSAVYDFLKENEYLPLPERSSLQRYMDDVGCVPFEGQQEGQGMDYAGEVTIESVMIE